MSLLVIAFEEHCPPPPLRPPRKMHAVHPTLQARLLTALDWNTMVRLPLNWVCRERKQEILQDSRVQAAMQRNRQPSDAKLTQRDESRQPAAVGR